MANIRKVTCRLFEMMDEGAIDPRLVAETCLTYMSESDVADMARVNGFGIDDDEVEDADSEPRLVQNPVDASLEASLNAWETFCATEGL